MSQEDVGWTGGFPSAWWGTSYAESSPYHVQISDDNLYSFFNKCENYYKRTTILRNEGKLTCIGTMMNSKTEWTTLLTWFIGLFNQSCTGYHEYIKDICQVFPKIQYSWQHVPVSSWKRWRLGWLWYESVSNHHQQFVKGLCCMEVG